MQGRRGTNPFKAKAKTVKDQKTASLSIKECIVARAKSDDKKPAWAMGSCLRGNSRSSVSNGLRVRIKERVTRTPRSTWHPPRQETRPIP